MKISMSKMIISVSSCIKKRKCQMVGGVNLGDTNLLICVFSGENFYVKNEYRCVIEYKKGKCKMLGV